MHINQAQCLVKKLKRSLVLYYITATTYRGLLVLSGYNSRGQVRRHGRPQENRRCQRVGSAHELRLMVDIAQYQIGDVVLCTPRRTYLATGLASVLKHRARFPTGSLISNREFEHLPALCHQGAKPSPGEASRPATLSVHLRIVRSPILVGTPIMSQVV